MDAALKTARMAFVINNAWWNDKENRVDKIDEGLKKAQIDSLPEGERKQFVDQLESLVVKIKTLNDKKGKVAGLIGQSFKQILPNITQILREGKEDLLVVYGEIMGIVCVVKGLKTNQIRKFLDAVLKLDMQGQKKEGFKKDKVFLLKPKIAYAIGKKGEEARPLMDVLSPCIDEVWTAPDDKSKDAFKKLVSFIEAIVAYHKFYGGRDS